MEKMPDCPFCTPDTPRIIVSNTLCYALTDLFPVSKGHVLIIPYRHTPDFFSLTREERYAMLELIDQCREILDRLYRPSGYNIGFNIGESAGQTVMHCHCHVIPRYDGDTDNPKGGVRRVVAGKYYNDPERLKNPRGDWPRTRAGE